MGIKTWVTRSHPVDVTIEANLCCTIYCTIVKCDVIFMMSYCLFTPIYLCSNFYMIKSLSLILRYNLCRPTINKQAYAIDRLNLYLPKFSYLYFSLGNCTLCKTLKLLTATTSLVSIYMSPVNSAEMSR